MAAAKAPWLRVLSPTARALRHRAGASSQCTSRTFPRHSAREPRVKSNIAVIKEPGCLRRPNRPPRPRAPLVSSFPGRRVPVLLGPVLTNAFQMTLIKWSPPLPLLFAMKSDVAGPITPRLRPRHVPARLWSRRGRGVVSARAPVFTHSARHCALD
ncbi:hypothetical protein MTO96_001026 [Rhipicephalus appendiculatus]